MSDEQKPKKRRFWQLHLSTAVISMLVIGFLLLKNIHLYERLTISKEAYGWPATIYEAERVRDAMYFPNIVFSPMNSEALFWDCIISIVIIAAFTVASEWLIRRREGRKP
jgi:hypothetical protein